MLPSETFDATFTYCGMSAGVVKLVYSEVAESLSYALCSEPKHFVSPLSRAMLESILTCLGAGSAQ